MGFMGGGLVLNEKTMAGQQGVVGRGFGSKREGQGTYPSMCSIYSHADTR